MGLLNDPALIGGLIGLAVGMIDYVIIRKMLAQIERNRGRPFEPGLMRLINFGVMASSFVVLPAIGWFIGPIVWNAP